MLAVTRYRVAQPDAERLRNELRAVLELLRAQRGFVRGHIGRAADDPDLWVLVTEWDGIGAYRRALSSYDVKVIAIPAMSSAIDEPGVFEVVDAEDPAPGPPQILG